MVLTGKSTNMYLGLRTIKLLPDLNNDGFDELFTSEGNYQSGGDDREKPVIFYGGMPIDSISDIILPYPSAAIDIGTYINDQDNSVHLLVGDPSDYASGPSMGRVIVHSNTVTGLIDTEKNELIPDKFHLSQNFPNPFNPTTTIHYKLPEANPVTIKIYNLLGQKIVTLVDKWMPAGSYQVKFDAAGFASGLYFYRIEAGKYSQVRKMMLLR